VDMMMKVPVASWLAQLAKRFLERETFASSSCAV